MDWSTKKFHYKIINQKGEIIGSVHKLLSELEDFVIKSRLEIQSLERTGINSFLVKVNTDNEWTL